MSGHFKGIYQSPFRPMLSAFVILVSAAGLVGAGGFPQTGTQTPNEFQKAFQAGKVLFENGEPKEATIKLLQALFITRENAEIAEACLYLALTYYALDEKDYVQLYLKKLFEAQPEKEIEAVNFSVGFVGLFYVAKNEAGRSGKPAAKSVSRGDVIPLSEVDVEPKIIKSVNPIYPPKAQQLRLERQMTFEALISEAGDVLQVRLINNSDRAEMYVKEFEEAAKKALLKWKFMPAQKGGISVRVWKPVNFIFKPN
jgi:TonB family protein